MTEDACELIKINRRELASDTRVSVGLCGWFDDDLYRFAKALGKQQDANSGVSTDAPDVDDERLDASVECIMQGLLVVGCVEVILFLTGVLSFEAVTGHQITSTSLLGIRGESIRVPKCPAVLA